MTLRRYSTDKLRDDLEQLSLQAAQQSLVLLKNDAALLPLDVQALAEKKVKWFYLGNKDVCIF